GPVQGPHQDLRLTAALWSENVGGEEAHARRNGEKDVGDRCAVRGALAAVVGQGLRLALHEDSPLDRVNLLAAMSEPLLEQPPLDATTDDADPHALASRARVAEQALGPHQGQDLLEDVGGCPVAAVLPAGRHRTARVGGVAHGPVSPSPPSSSSRSRSPSIRRRQWRTVAGPCFSASARTVSARRRASSVATGCGPGPPRLSCSCSITAGGGGSSRRSAAV